MSPENFRNIYAIQNLRDHNDSLISVREWDNKQTDTHTRILKLFKSSVETAQKCFHLRKIAQPRTHTPAQSNGCSEHYNC